MSRLAVRLKREGMLAAALIAPMLFFFHDMLFAGRGFFYGDYRAQYYPWALELARSLRRLALPIWSGDIGCGFPILAEGQAGALQPIKWLLYGALPIEWGYPLGFLAAFFAAGWGVCAYFRRAGRPFMSGVIAAWVYCYGSAYAGLAWGNASLWVMAFLPLVLDRAEALCAKPVLRNVCKLGLAASLLWLGGFPQMALYACLFTGGYIVLRRPSAVLSGAAGLAAGLAAASAQVLPTLELAALSARSQTGLDFALQKSLHPANAAALVMPSLGFLGADLYVGILPLVFAVFAVWRLRRDPAARAVAVMTAAALFLALGKWNPLYVAIVRTFELYSFRGSSKWLMSATLGLALLAGFGWGAWWKEGVGRAKRLSAVCVAGSAAAVWAAVFAAARWGAPAIQRWVEAYVRSDVYGKGGHPHSLESYLARIPGLIGMLAERTSLSNYYVICVAAALAALLVWMGIQRHSMTAASWRRAKVLAAALVLADLFWFSWVGSGFKGNRVPGSALEPGAAVSYVLKQDGDFRVYEWIEDPMRPPAWIPNSNLIAGYSSVGVYTPLTLAAYSRRVDGLGAVDDSTGVRPAPSSVFTDRADLLGRLNVRYLLSREAVADPGSWKTVLTEEGGSVLYEQPVVWPRAYPLGARTPEEAARRAVILERSPGYYRVRVSGLAPDRLIVTENAYGAGEAWSSGWRAQVDGVSVPVEKYEETFVSVPVGTGSREVVLKFHSTVFRAGLLVSLAAFVILGWGARRSRRRS
jgi:hypothetical protein